MNKPNYYNCILNIISSIKKYYNLNVNYPSNKIIDEVLNINKPKHIILMLLDGLGSNILNIHENACDFLINNKIEDISSVFPPTTSAAIPACISGKAPIETCWVGWENYIKQIDRHVVFFKNTDYIDNSSLNINVLDIFPYDSFTKDLSVNSFSVGPAFYVDGCKNFEEVTCKLNKIINSNDSSFTYAYWDDPDYTLHEFGTKSIKVKESLVYINEKLISLSEKLKDTCLIISADHGHIDCSPIYLKKYKDLYDTLERMPGNEPRCTFFKVKKDCHDLFEELFNKYFKDDFLLLTKDEFLNEELLGLNEFSNKYEKIEELIGDYVGIAISDKYFNYVNKDESEAEMIFKSHHAGMTKEEMTVPLIIFNK